MEGWGNRENGPRPALANRNEILSNFLKLEKGKDRKKERRLLSLEISMLIMPS